MKDFNWFLDFLSPCPSVIVSVCHPVRPSPCLSVTLSVTLSVCHQNGSEQTRRRLSVCHPVCLSPCPSPCPSVTRTARSRRAAVCPSVTLSVCHPVRHPVRLSPERLGADAPPSCRLLPQRRLPATQTPR